MYTCTLAVWVRGSRWSQSSPFHPVLHWHRPVGGEGALQTEKQHTTSSGTAAGEHPSAEEAPQAALAQWHSSPPLSGMTLSNTFKTLSMSGTVADTAVQIGTRGPRPREWASAFSVHTLSMLVTVVEALDIVHTEYGGHLPLTPVVRVERAGWAGPGRGRDGGRG